MNLFQLNLVAWGDQAGLGAYEIGHYLQHRNYADTLHAGRGIFVPDEPILHLVGANAAELASWLSFHEGLHERLRQIANITGVNLGSLDPSSPEDFAIWQDAHRTEHARFDAIFGTT